MWPHDACMGPRGCIHGCFHGGPVGACTTPAHVFVLMIIGKPIRGLELNAFDFFPEQTLQT